MVPLARPSWMVAAERGMTTSAGRPSRAVRKASSACFSWSMSSGLLSGLRATTTFLRLNSGVAAVRAGALTAATANTVSRRERRTGNRCDTFIRSGAAKLRTLMRASFNRRKKARRRICRRALDVVRRAALSRGGWSDRGEDFVESLAGTERGGGLGGVGTVVAADVVGAALHCDQLGDDVGLGGGEFLGD